MAVVRGASVILLALLLATCSPVAPVQPLPAPVQPAPGPTLLWSRGLEFGADYWRIDAEDRFGPRVVVLLCHGVSRDGRWLTDPDAPVVPADVQAVAETLRAAYPDRPVVLVVCNPGGAELRPVPGVYYARRDVLVPPFKFEPGTRIRWKGVCGSVWEMRE